MAGPVGPWAFGLVALIVFAETGLVFAPFLPGDSLLFVTGAATRLAGLERAWRGLLLVAAAVAGDALNFAIGRRAGRGWWLASGASPEARPPGADACVLPAFWALDDRRCRCCPWCARWRPSWPARAACLARVSQFNVLGGTVWSGVAGVRLVLARRAAVRRGRIGSITIGIVALSLLPVVLAAVRARTRARPAGM